MPKTVQGFMLIDVDVAALNNLGKDTSTHLENAVATKKIIKAGKNHAYVSGQAWRYWWRETLKKDFGWVMSPVLRESKVAFTEANPIVYPDDDVFGYMRAAKEEKVDASGKKKKENVTLTRISPLKNSALIAISPTSIVQHWSAMTRQEGDAVPYGKDEYCATMKGMFSIALEQVGTFCSEDRSGYKNLNEDLKNEARKKGAEEIDDPYAKGRTGEPLKLYRLPKEVRRKRVADVLLALETLNGGAMQTSNMADVAPKLVVLATLNSGNHPFSHLAKDDLGKPCFSIAALKEVVRDYGERFIGTICIGRRMGFMDELDQELSEYAKEEKIYYGPVNQALREYVARLETELP